MGLPFKTMVLLLSVSFNINCLRLIRKIYISKDCFKIATGIEPLVIFFNIQI